MYVFRAERFSDEFKILYGRIFNKLDYRVELVSLRVRWRVIMC